MTLCGTSRPWNLPSTPGTEAFPRETRDRYSPGVSGAPRNAKDAPEWTRGQIVGGKYRVDRVVGQGGMGVVVAATHIELDEHVALKFLRRDLSTDAELVARFTQEARDAVKLKSEYVARTFDVGVDSGIPFIVMELLEGHDLGRELDLKGTVPVEIAAEYMVQACAGVATAHARGIVHRDIKPENLFLAERGDGSSIVKVLDFGISKAVLSASAARAPILGSPFYMSPEQLRGGDVDFRSDIWSLGAVLFELLTGVHAFDTEQALGPLLRAVRKSAPRKITDFRPEAPAALSDLIDHCLQKDPAARVQSAAELAIALLAFAPRRARVAAERASSLTRAAGLSAPENLALPPSMVPPPVADVGASVALPAPPRVPKLPDVAPEPRRSPAWVVLMVALVVVVLGIAVFSAR